MNFHQQMMIVRIPASVLFTTIKSCHFIVAVYVILMWMSHVPVQLLADESPILTAPQRASILTLRNIQFLAPHLEILPDTLQSLNFQDILTDSLRFVPFSSLQKTNLNAGFTSTAYWLRFRVRDTLDRAWFLTFVPISFTDSIRCYIQSPDGSWRERVSGMSVQIAERDVPWRTPAFKIPFVAAREFTVILRLSGKWIFSNEPVLMTEVRLQSHIQLERFIYGIFIGIMLGLVLYNWFIYSRTRDRAYGFYLLHITFFAVTEYCLKSLWYYEFIPQWAVHIPPVRFVLFEHCSTLYMMLFVAEFLHLREAHPRLMRFIHGAVLVNLFVGLAAFLPNGIVSHVMGIVSGVSGAVLLASIVLVLFVLIQTLRSQERAYRSAGAYFLSAWIIFLLCSLLNILLVQDVIPFALPGGVNFIAYYGTILGFSLGMIFFSFALADRFRAIKQAFDSEHQAKLLAEQEQKLIAERNLELELLNADMLKQRKEMERQNDELLYQKLALELSNREMMLANEAIQGKTLALADQKRSIEAAHIELQQINNELVRQQHLLEEQAVETELLNSSLHERNEELQQLNLEKSELLGIVSHDLKNPIASILGLTEVLAYDTELPIGHQKQIYTILHETAQRMNTLVSRLLDANAIETGQFQIRKKNLDIVPLVRESLEFYLPLAEKKEMTFREQYDETVMAFADEQMVAQIIDNLVSNAVKYSPIGKTITIAALNVHAHAGLAASLPELQALNIQRTELLANADFAVLIVKDEGPGLTDDDKQKLFGKYTRLSARPTGGENSTGLGLSIAKKMVEAMNGRIWCESEFGKGATFVVGLPRA
jgi:signal transduction histidine kinase